MAAITFEELSMKVGVCHEKFNDSISDEHLHEISTFLTSWQRVAPSLKIYDVEDIEQEKDEQVKRLKILQKWKGIFGFKATYRKLVDVLLSLAKADVAEKVCNLLKATKGVPVHVSVNSDSMKLQLVSREPESSDGSTVKGTNTGLTRALAIQPAFQKLNPNERVELLSKLYDDEKSMTREFASLVTATLYSVQERVPTDVFCVSILLLKAYEPAPGEQDRSLLDEHCREIKEAKIIAEIFKILTPYWNYLNYEILEYIIKDHGTRNDCEKLKEYEAKLYSFCERRIFELPLLDNDRDIEKTFQNQVKFTVKLDKDEDIKGKELLQIRTQIAKILQVNVAAFVISRVDPGCVLLTFLIPKFVSQEIFPLSCEQTSALSKDASVIWLECGDYIYKSTSKNYTEDATQTTASIEVLKDRSQLQKELCAEKPVDTAQHSTSGEMRDPVSQATLTAPVIDPDSDIGTSIGEGNFLHIAARQGRLDTVKHLIEKGTDVDARDDDGMTPLHVAAERGYIKIVDYLVGKGADIDIQDEKGRTPLHLAAEKGRFENTLKYLVDKGAGINIKDNNGRTPLHIAVKHFQVRTVEFLVDEGADINSKDIHGLTPLHMAAKKDRCEQILGYLVDKDADINIKDKNGHTPLHIAVKEFQVHTMEALVVSKADINSQDKDGMTPLHVAAEKGDCLDIVKYLIGKGADINIKDYSGQTPMHTAAKEGNEFTMKGLVKLGAAINIKDKNGRTSLDVAVERGYLNIAEVFTGGKMSEGAAFHGATDGGHIDKGANTGKKENSGGNSIHKAARQGELDTVRCLIDEGTDVNIKDHDGVTPLHVAAERGHPRIVEYLVGKGADIDIQNNNGQTPSHLAAEKGRFENTLKYLVDKQADINFKDNDGRTPLHIAVKEFRVETAEFLVDNKADINSKDNDGWTPLHIAAGEGRCEDTLKYLVGKGADVNVKDNNGWAPLHIAVRKFQVRTVEFLVANGADVSIKNNDGMTPLHVAAKKGESLEIVKYLICKGADINVQNNNKQAPLHTAAEDGNEFTMKELVKLGADINIKDKDGRTPLDVAVKKGYDVIAENFRDTGKSEEVSDISDPETGQIKKDKAVPAAPTILAVEATSSTSLSVKWAACNSDGGSPITGYVVEYYGESDSGLQTQVFASNVLSTILDQLTPSTEYNVMVSVENAVGRSGPSVTMRAKTKVDVKLNYEREMRYGHIASSIAKVLLFGIAGSGKTSATAILMGKDPPSIRTSTPLMTRPVQVLTILIKELTKWEKKTPEEVRRIVAEIIRSRELPSEIQEIQELAQTDSKSRETSSNLQETTSKLQKTHLSKPPQPKQVQPQEGQPLLPTQPLQETYYQPKSKQVHPKEGQAPKPKSKFDLALESVMKEDDFVSIVHDCNKPSKPILEQRWLYIIDSGGQPEFHDMLSIFVQKATACIFVCRMHDKLDDYPPVELYRDGSSVGPIQKPRLTNGQLFERFMCTMLSFKNKDLSPSILLFKNESPPHILVLATHRDLVQGGELPKPLVDGLTAIALPQLKKQLIYCDTKRDKFIFTMNAKQPEDRDRETANQIRKVVTEGCPWDKVNIPIRWYDLDHQSRMISNHLNREVLSREEYGKIAKELDIDEDSCEGALEFFNSLNTIFYFPKALPDVVFLEPQILLNLLNELVTKKYRADQHARTFNPSECHFCEFAQVTEELLKEFKEHYHPPLFTSMELTILFEKLLIFGKLGEGKWFVPSILLSLKEEELEKYREKESKKEALVIAFPEGGPQNGIFCSTVSFLLSTYNSSPSPWRVLKDSYDKPKCLNRNIISFTVKGISGKVTLIEECKHFEVYVNTSIDKECLWKLVYKAVFDGLKKAAETHHYTYTDNNGPQPAIICPEQHHPAPHPAAIDYKEGTWRWICTKSELDGHVPSGNIPWLTYVRPQITQQPADELNVVPRSPVKFTLIANTDFGTLTYKWQWNDADLDPLPEGVSGETTHILQIDNVEKTHEGTYTCIVSNAVGPNSSKSAQLTVLGPPQITQHPEPQKDIVAGSTVRFTITATGGGDLTYKWQQNGADLDPLLEGMSGENTHTLKIDNVEKSHQGDYRCIVSNAAGPTPSNPAQLAVLDPPQITHGPESQKDIVPGSTVRFTITTTGGGDLAYKWQQNGTDIDPLPKGMSGETTHTLKIDSVRKSHQGEYRCLVSNAAGDVTSEPAQLTVHHNWRMQLLTAGCIFVLVLVLCGIGAGWWLRSEVAHPFGNVRSPLKYDAPPALDVLRYFPVKDGHIDIAQEIGTDYEKFGTLLLEDKTGNKVNNIKASERDNSLLITVEILRQWLQGKGKEPVTWRTLVTCLRATGLNVLAENIDHSLSEHNENKETKNLDRDHSEF